MILNIGKVRPCRLNHAKELHYPLPSGDKQPTSNDDAPLKFLLSGVTPV